jgi:hypothetical protein
MPKDLILTDKTCDSVSKDYKDIRVVFSGRRGFYMHVLDLNVEDWKRYNVSNPLKSHKVARFLYSLELLKKSPRGI